MFLSSFFQHKFDFHYLHIPMVYSFLMLSSISLYEYTKICLSILLLINIWYVSRFIYH